MARSKNVVKYSYNNSKHDDNVQQFSFRSTALLLKTVEVIVFNNGRVWIQESTIHIASKRFTYTPTIELIGEEGAEEAEYRINEMQYYRAR